MTERHVFGLAKENDLVSATEMTGAIPAITDQAGSPRHEGAEDKQGVRPNKHAVGP